MIILLLEIILTYIFAQSLFDLSNNKRTKLSVAVWGKKFDEIYIKHAKKLKIIAIALYACAIIKILIALTFSISQ